MILRIVKIGAIAAAGACLVGGLLFGTDLVSYVTSSARSVQTAVKDAVPIEFELRRARDLLDDIIPEMQANVRLIAQEEVEVANIKTEIEQQNKATAQERQAVAKLRETLGTDQVKYAFAGQQYSRQQVKEELSRRFDRFKESEVVLAGKQRLLSAREKSLNAAMEVLERSRTQKARLEDQIESLQAQYRLVKAASVGSRVQVDNSKLAQTEKLIGEIKKRLDVAERVLAHETHFVTPIPVDTISEKDLISQVDDHLAAQKDTAVPAGNGSVALNGAR
jgi:acyl carrier protein phosphodiesterase